MQLGPKEKNVIVRAALVFVVAVVVPSYLTDEASNYRNTEVSRQQQLQNQRADLQAKLDGIEEQRQLFRRNLESYNRWQERGAITESVDPVGWLNLMRQIRQQRRLSGISYDFGDNITVSPEGAEYTKEGTANINMIPMRVEMPMLHDMDMFMFLEDLASQADELFFPVSCTLDRLEADFSPVVRNNVNAECHVVWVFMQDPDQGKGVL